MFHWVGYKAPYFGNLTKSTISLTYHFLDQVKHFHTLEKPNPTYSNIPLGDMQVLATLHTPLTTSVASNQEQTHKL